VETTYYFLISQEVDIAQPQKERLNKYLKKLPKEETTPKTYQDLREDVTINPDHSLFYSRSYCPV